MDLCLLLLGTTHISLSFFMSVSDSMAEAGYAFANRMGVLVPEHTKLHLAMIVCQLGYAGNHIIMKTALNMGISMLVLPVYRNIVALVALVPFAYFLEKYAVKLILHIYKVFYVLSFIFFAILILFCIYII